MSTPNTTQLLQQLGNTEQKQKFSVRELVFKYLSYLPLFVLSFVIFFGSSILYIRYKVPIYNASVQVLVSNGGSNNVVQQDLISQAVSGVRPINLENEMQLIRSSKLLEKVVRQRNFNIVYRKEGNIKDYDAYDASPMELVPLKVEDSSKNYALNLKQLNDVGGVIVLEKGKIDFKWGDSIALPGFNFRFKKRFSTIGTIQEPYTVQYNSIAYAVKDVQGRLSIATLSSKTSILVINLTGENRKKVEDFLNLMVKEVVKSDVQQKQESSVNTIDFIENRLTKVAQDLSELEAAMKNTKNNPRFFDFQSEYTYYQGRLTESEKTVESLKLDISIIELIEDYIKNNKSYGKSKVIPSNFDVNDMAFNALIQKYNDVVQRKEKADLVTLKENTVIEELNNELNNVKANILEAATSLKNAKRLKISSFGNRFDTDLKNITAVPDKERQQQEIVRQKQIKEKLYLYLLQKREETAIASISTTSNYQPMDPAKASRFPIEPRADQIKTFALIFGLVFPVLFIYLLDLMNDKITTRQDIVTKSPIPIAGEISHVESNDSIVVENSRNIVAEQFRILRSNLQFILPLHKEGGGAKTLLVTSSVSGEGKSFISLNLAAVLSLTGKKVALMAFDLRKLKGLKLPGMEEYNEKGITNYLIGQTDHIAGLHQVLPKHPSLHVYNTGPIPPNPAELIISPRMEALFAYLKANYDYVVVDSAPVGLVSDSFALSKYADAVMYIVRQRYTFKKQLEFVNDLHREGKLTNMAIIVNDVNLAGRYGYYGYGYGYGYGYMYQYGLGYGYSRYIYGGKKKDPYFDANKKGYFDDEVKRSWWQKLFGK